MNHWHTTLATEQALPHEQNYTRLAPSRLGGVGIFAWRDIPRGTMAFTFKDTSGELHLSKEQVGQLPPDARELYHDHALVMPDGSWFVPADLNNQHQIWYLNHSADPNMAPTDQYNWYATRDIKAGEELTGNYDDWDAEGSGGFGARE